MQGEEGHQLLAPAAVADQYGGLADAGVLGDAGLDLAGLDAETVDLHLVVNAADVFEGVVVRAPAGQVAGAVQAFAGH